MKVKEEYNIYEKPTDLAIDLVQDYNKEIREFLAKGHPVVNRDNISFDQKACNFIISRIRAYNTMWNSFGEKYGSYFVKDFLKDYIIKEYKLMGAPDMLTKLFVYL